MSKVLSKITIASVAITTVIGGTIYLTSTPRDNNIASKSNSALSSHNVNSATLVSVRK